MSNGAQVASSSEQNSPAPGGSVTVTARDSVAISGTSTGLFSTTASPDPLGAAGKVVVTAPTLTIADHGKISVESTGAALRGRHLAHAGHSDPVRRSGSVLERDVQWARRQHQRAGRTGAARQWGDDLGE